MSQHSGSVYEVHGAIHTKWQQRGFAGGFLGLPTSDETTAQPSGASGSTGKLNQFQGGQIYWKTGTAEAYEVHGSIVTTYVGMGGSASWLGFPTSDEFVAPTNFPRSNFERGYITWNGSSYSAFSNTTCSYSISPTSRSLGAGSGTDSVAVTTGAGCTWGRTSNASWITITSGGSGNGNGSVNYSVAQNTGGARSGTMTIAGQTFTVSQSAGSTICPAPAAMTIGQNINGNLQNRGCFRNGRYYDAYTFTGTFNHLIYIHMASQFDTYLYLYRGNYPGGTLVASNDDGGGGYNSRIPAYSGYYRLPASGTFTLLASSYYNGSTGSYTLTSDSPVGTTVVDPAPPPLPFDFDGDGKADLSVYRPSNNIWYLQRSKDGYTEMTYGVAGDRVAPADYDGDGKTDVAVWRPSDGKWYVFNSGTQSFSTDSWGQNGDLPAPADHDGDGKADFVVFRPSNNIWYIKSGASGAQSSREFGVAGDKPVIGDFDGDGRADIGVFRPSDNNWYVQRTTADFTIHTWGQSGDIPVPADYDRDGKTDLAVFRPSTGQWFRNMSSAGIDVKSWGQNGDMPVAADYDGDGKADIAVFRPSNATWYIVGTSAGQLIPQFGQNGDKPTPNAFIY